jgi:hypothetical protein
MARRPDSLSRANRQLLTEARKAVFLDELRRHAVFARAARAASPRASDGAVSTFRDAVARDPRFAQQVEEAREQADADLLVELRRRAVDGDQVPIQNAKGEVIGWRSLRSDKLLLEMVRARHREFTPRTQTEATVEQKVTPRPDHLAALETLSEESREDLLRIIRREKALRDTQHDDRSDGHAPYPGLPIVERER